MARDRFSL